MQTFNTISMSACFWVAAGGALGSVARFCISSLMAARLGESFPWGTILVNVSGSFAIGLFAALNPPATPETSPLPLRYFLMIGLCGGYTTFSSFSLETLKLLQLRQFLHASGNIALSIAACLIAVWAGYLLGAAIRSKTV